MDMNKRRLQATFWKWFGSTKADRILTGLLVVAFVVMVIAALAIKGEAHEVHLSEIGDQTVESTTPCPQLSGYVIKSEERGCFLIYLMFPDVVEQFRNKGGEEWRVRIKVG